MDDSCLSLKHDKVVGDKLAPTEHTLRYMAADGCQFVEYFSYVPRINIESFFSKSPPHVARTTCIKHQKDRVNDFSAVVVSDSCVAGSEKFLTSDPNAIRFGHAEEGRRRSEPVREVGPRSNYCQARSQGHSGARQESLMSWCWVRRV